MLGFPLSVCRALLEVRANCRVDDCPVANAGVVCRAAEALLSFEVVVAGKPSVSSTFGISINLQDLFQSQSVSPRS